VVPLLVLLGWAIGQPLDFLFDPLETLLVFLCIASVNWGSSFASFPSLSSASYSLSSLFSSQPSATAGRNGWRGSRSWPPTLSSREFPFLSLHPLDERTSCSPSAPTVSAHGIIPVSRMPKPPLDPHLDQPSPSNGPFSPDSLSSPSLRAPLALFLSISTFSDPTRLALYRSCRNRSSVPRLVSLPQPRRERGRVGFRGGRSLCFSCTPSSSTTAACCTSLAVRSLRLSLNSHNLRFSLPRLHQSYFCPPSLTAHAGAGSA
jgi:hypothetical protein